jgi:hypothetical protein
MTADQDDYRQRLHDGAEAFYYAGILTSLHFDAASVDAGDFRDVQAAARDAAYGPENDRKNNLGAPPIVNFAFAVELYIKLLRHLADAVSMRGHRLYDLFLKLDKAAGKASASVINNHAHSRGCREEFMNNLKDLDKAFEDWRYAHDKAFLCSSPDALLVLASSFRKALRELHPGLRSSFQREP